MAVDVETRELGRPGAQASDLALLLSSRAAMSYFFYASGVSDTSDNAAGHRQRRTDCPGRGAAWKRLWQRSAPRVTALRCPTQRDAIAAEAI